MEKMPYIGLFHAMSKFFKLCALVLTIFALSSCEHKDLCYHHLHTAQVNVIFDWQYAPDANPKTMILYLFSKEKGTDDRYDFTNIYGGQITEFAGEYTAVCFNGGTENIRFTTADVDDDALVGSGFIITTASTELLSRLNTISSKAIKKAPRASGSEDERVAAEPDRIWTDNLHNVSLFASNDVVQNITLYPQQAYCTYTVKVINVSNIGGVAEVSATLAGQAGGLIPLTNTVTDEVVTIPFGMQVDADNNCIDAQFLTFGHCPEGADNTHTLSIYTVLTSGEKYVYYVDVTDQIHNANDPRNVTIIVDGLPLPEPIENTGFDISVDTWQTVFIDVKME